MTVIGDEVPYLAKVLCTVPSRWRRLLHWQVMFHVGRDASMAPYEATAVVLASRRGIRCVSTWIAGLIGVPTRGVTAVAVTVSVTLEKSRQRFK